MTKKVKQQLRLNKNGVVNRLKTIAGKAAQAARGRQNVVVRFSPGSCAVTIVSAMPLLFFFNFKCPRTQSGEEIYRSIDEYRYFLPIDFQVSIPCS